MLKTSVCELLELEYPILQSSMAGYYDPGKGAVHFDGMVPLLMAALVWAGIFVTMVI